MVSPELEAKQAVNVAKYVGDLLRKRGEILDSAGPDDLIECVAEARSSRDMDDSVKEHLSTAFELLGDGAEEKPDYARAAAVAVSNLSVKHDVRSLQYSIHTHGGIVLHQHVHKTIFAATKGTISKLERSGYAVDVRRKLDANPAPEPGRNDAPILKPKGTKPAEHAGPTA
jgi:hypothetical protein